jgi:hypothetical protein
MFGNDNNSDIGSNKSSEYEDYNELNKKKDFF